MALTRDAASRQDGDALALRYGRASIPAAGPWNDVIASLLDHRSVRGFGPIRCQTGTLETLVAAAQSAATSSNLQTWSVVAVSRSCRASRVREDRQQSKAHRAVPAVPVLDRRCLAARAARRTGEDRTREHALFRDVSGGGDRCGAGGAERCCGSRSRSDWRRSTSAPCATYPCGWRSC